MFSKLVSAKIHQKCEMCKGFSNASLANRNFSNKTCINTTVFVTLQRQMLRQGLL